MKMTKTLLAALLAMAVLGTVTTVRAADEAKPETKAKPEAKAKTEAGAEKKPEDAKKGLPYGGTIAAVDKAAGTITLKRKEAEKTFVVNSETKIRRNGKATTLDDAKVGEESGVSYREEDGKNVALSLRVGPKPEKKDGAAPAPKKEKKEKKTEGEATK